MGVPVLGRFFYSDIPNANQLVLTASRKVLPIRAKGYASNRARAHIDPDVTDTLCRIPQTYATIPRAACKEPTVGVKRKRFDWLRVSEHHLG